MKKHPKDTAIHRVGPSAPLRWLLKHGHIPTTPVVNGHHLNAIRVLDYGCGYGTDARYLQALGYDAHGYDPFHAVGSDPDCWAFRYHFVTCTYVLNVILEEQERELALRNIRALLACDGVAYVTVRRDLDGDTESQRLIFLDFPLLHDGSDFATYRVQAS